MAYSDRVNDQEIEDIWQYANQCSPQELERVLGQGSARSIADFATLISPAAAKYVEPLAQSSRSITQRHFGKAIRFFAPLYLSNECVNICKYCGFSRNNDIPRITIPVTQVVKETRKLAQQGMRSLLLVAGEHPKYVSNGYVEDCIEQCLEIMPSIILELGPLETEPYRPMVKAGAEGLVVYQETYHRESYKALHVAGPKKKYDWRLDTAERAYEAGFRRLGIGALLGLYDWRYEAIALAAHAQYLTQKCWRAQITISLPRMRPANGGFALNPDYQNSDRDFVQLITALRHFLPHAGIVLSTRESPSLRNGLVGLGITQMSAGASTEPGGYSSFDENQWVRTEEQPGEQFHIADERPPAEVAAMIRSKGYEVVWKDFDQSLVA